MKIEEAAKILVLDPIHGAEIIAEELKALGKETDIFNPYRRLKKFEQNAPRKRLSKYDLVISPVHLNPDFEIVKQISENNIDSISHHEAVKEIARIKNLFEGIKVVEVTGTIGKTTVCSLIYQMLRYKTVLLHTSSSTRFRSVADDDEIIFPRISITPANVLKVIEIAAEKNLKPDIAVFEVSLGLTGIGDTGVITSLKEGNRIAGGMRDESAVIEASITNCAEKSIIVHPDNSFPGAKGNLWFDEIKLFDESEYEPEYYKNSVKIAFSALLSLEIPPEEIATNISAIDGRMKLQKVKGRFLIDNSNSGTKLTFLAEITKMAKRVLASASASVPEKKILIVGEESEYICEGIDLDELKRVVKEEVDEFFEIFIVGDKFKDKIEGKNVLFFATLDTALERAIKDSEEGSVIISNVKTWR
ncbi:MAG: hypothetical protein H0M93_04025 [Methanophagales archaeon]|nr:hypothetical protein [Methanophagales archaeon]